MVIPRLFIPAPVSGSGNTTIVTGLIAALCRMFNQDGWRVAPFKAQNMALNSFATRDGGNSGAQRRCKRTPRVWT